MCKPLHVDVLYVHVSTLTRIMIIMLVGTMGVWSKPANVNHFNVKVVKVVIKDMSNTAI